MLFSSCSEQGLLPRCRAWASHCSGSSCCRPGSVAVAQGLSCSSPYGILQTRDQPCISCICSWILIHWDIGGPSHKLLDLTIRYIDCMITYFFWSVGSFRPSLLVPSFSSTFFYREVHSFSSTYSSHLTWGSDSVVLPFFHLIPLVNPVSVCL